MHHVVAMLHYWPYEDSFIKELGNRVLKVNATSEIPIPLLEVEQFVMLQCI